MWQVIKPYQITSVWFDLLSKMAVTSVDGELSVGQMLHTRWKAHVTEAHVIYFRLKIKTLTQYIKKSRASKPDLIHSAINILTSERKNL